MARVACWFSVVAATIAIVTTADIHSTDVYSRSDCSGVPDHFRISQRRPCALSNSKCEAKEVSNQTEYDVCSSISDPQTHAAEVFGGVPSMLTNAFNDNNCDEYTGSFAYRADGSCFKVDAQSSQLLILNANGSVTWKQYAGVAREDKDLSTDLHLQQRGVHLLQ
ncbi:hypothetical protein PHYSODRAFT_337519 [Phytophthora sojae]|uniref:Uncharacterized protein n=1 Tax=Phytophthora sojae (strain P6497) TaxID=1094619 RepID=G5A1E3_PHYSP|nr:hypothetical protein PHYSODRAFT_337519 [Phytophthora sojae]EGZ10742.1 hypothetical protein PHYSODRAFT_337519 [Phytophthora sojae]|eukprot:XP_009533487.1 hypothetical protein PHYSODRAFT_337519 [Phytophthora sojae]